jgi:threonine dehydrogenase-like Zn-dependent dehydrogenase
MREGLIIGHERVGVIEALGPGVTGYQRGDRVIIGAITPCGQCRASRQTGAGIVPQPVPRNG